MVEAHPIWKQTTVLIAMNRKPSISEMNFPEVVTRANCERNAFMFMRLMSMKEKWQRVVTVQYLYMDSTVLYGCITTLTIDLNYLITEGLSRRRIGKLAIRID